MLNKDFLHELRKRIESSSHGTKKELISTWANNLNISEATLYRELRKEFGKQKTIYREKKIDEEIIVKIYNLKKKSAIKGKVISTKDCIDKLYKSGIIKTNNLSASTINRRIKEAGLIIPKPKELTKEERNLIEKYRNLNKESKLIITKTMDQFIK